MKQLLGESLRCTSGRNENLWKSLSTSSTLISLFSSSASMAFTLSSPSCRSAREKSIERPSMRAGVPVFILKTENPNSISCSESPVDDGSAMRPPAILVAPKCINPLRNVPFVSTTFLASKMKPSDVFTPDILIFSPLSSKISPLTIS